ncbi:hypothetical protein R3W88_002410 [Solanum pinnatisectum]|uniref:K-box domain-containing protein n=1 Tax=Solanum pinnatisectum TaxID=50273 RepID=A0AAV9ML53_9SOLN|nr:hypothetical protein R3W88_002410 [Solanum pinnatisectum]
MTKERISVEAWKTQAVMLLELSMWRHMQKAQCASKGKKSKQGEFCSTREIIERYKRHTKDRVQPENQAGAQHQHMQHEAANLMKKIELLETSKRKFLGEGLQSCTLQEVQQIEKQLERSVSTIRTRKLQVYKEQVERLKEKEKILAAENAKLREKFGSLQERQTPSVEKEGETLCTDGSEKSDVETELFIGPPECRVRRL